MYNPSTAVGRDDISVQFERYKQSGDVAIRNDIVMRSMHIVRYAVLSTRNMFRKYTTDDDVSNEAVLALINAAECFDPEKNVKFDTYATIKVRGAIIDYVRKLDTVPRGVRKFARDYDAAFSELYEKFDREPSREELAAHMGITPEKLDSFCAKSAAANTLSFEEMVLNGFDRAEDNEDGCFEAERGLMLEERKFQLARAIEALKEKERMVITLYYYEKLKYSEIAQVLDISESRVCQVHSRAVEKLRLSLEEYLLK